MFKRRKDYETRQLHRLEQAIHVSFKERSLLRQAVVHRSFFNEHPELGLKDYERLEYLGDAFLGLVVAEELFRRYPELQEGGLTRARSLLVQGRTLAEIARSFDLGSYLYLGQGEEESGGRNRQLNLAGALEAVLGAVLIDRGQKAAWDLVLRWLGQRIEAIGETGAPRDAKSALQEKAQQTGLPLPEYKIVEEDGESHNRRYLMEVWLDGKLAGQGRGRRKVDAEKSAAEQALADWDAVSKQNAHG
ncbi:MAG: ribonuclease III [Chloroflexi bacterium]|nr:ribonuclease III [Chloroflexota bacterium]